MAWWAVLVGVVAFAVLIFTLICTGDRSPLSSKAKKHKRSRKQKCSAPATKLTSPGTKRSLLAFKHCISCNLKITVTDIHNTCLTCLGMKHPMFRCTQCLSLKWKAFRARFLRQYLWYILYKGDKHNNAKPPSARISTKLLAQNIIERQGKEEYTDSMKNVSDAFKKANSQIQTPEDLSSSFSPLEEGEGAAVDSSSSSESNTPRSQSVAVEVHVTDNASVSSPAYTKDETVVQMEGEAASAQSTSVDTGCGVTVHSLALETQAQTPMEYGLLS